MTNETQYETAEIRNLLIQLQHSMTGLQHSLDLILTSIEELKKSVREINQPTTESEVKQVHLRETLEIIQALMEENDGIPPSRAALAKRMGLSESTIYFRCKRLVELGKIQIFYGRDLGLEHRSKAKTLYYAIPRTLHDISAVEALKNEVAKKVVMALLEMKKISENDLAALTKEERKVGLSYLLSRGLITQEINKKGVLTYMLTGYPKTE